MAMAAPQKRNKTDNNQRIQLACIMDECSIKENGELAIGPLTHEPGQAIRWSSAGAV
jgi:hypothetical protein